MKRIGQTIAIIIIACLFGAPVWPREDHAQGYAKSRVVAYSGRFNLAGEAIEVVVERLPAPQNFVQFVTFYRHWDNLKLSQWVVLGRDRYDQFIKGAEVFRDVPGVGYLRLDWETGDGSARALVYRVTAQGVTRMLEVAARGDIDAADLKDGGRGLVAESLESGPDGAHLYDLYEITQGGRVEVRRKLSAAELDRLEMPMK